MECFVDASDEPEAQFCSPVNVTNVVHTCKEIYRFYNIKKNPL